MEEDIKIDTLSEFEQELYILAEEMARVNFFIIYYDNFSLVCTYRTKEQMIQALIKDEEKYKELWPNVYEVKKSDIQSTMDEFEKIYCPELRAEYVNIFELLRDLKVFSLASLIE